MALTRDPRDQKITPKKTILILANLLLIASLACSSNLFATSQPRPQGETALIEQQVTAPSQPLPPILVETNPSPGSEVNSINGVTLFFSHAMNRESVEAALNITPNIPHRLEWLEGNHALRILPNEMPPPNTGLFLRLESSAKAENGLSLLDPLELQFRTPDLLRISERIPSLNEVDVQPDGAVVASFNQPVVPLGIESSTLPPAFLLSPAASGHGEWLNTSTFIFYPDPPLVGGMPYRVKVNEALVSAAGAPLAIETSGVEWLFTTATPRLVSIQPDPNLPLFPDSTIELTFNQPMDKNSLEKNLVLTAGDGSTVRGNYTWDHQGSRVTFTPVALLEHNADYTLHLARDLLSRGGVPLTGAQDIVFRCSDSLAVDRTDPAQGNPLQIYGAYSSILIHFNNPLKKQKLDDLVQINPPVSDQSLFSGGKEDVIFLSGIYEANTAYTVTLSPDLLDRWGQPLGKEVNLVFHTTPAAPSLTIPALDGGSIALFIDSGHPVLRAFATNTPTVQVLSGPLNLGQFIRLNEMAYTETLKEDAAATTALKPYSLNIQPDRSTLVEIPLSQADQALETGLYFFNILTPGVSTENRFGLRPFLGISGQVDIVLKRSPKELFFWLANLSTGQPLAGVTAVVYDGQFQTVGQVVTDEQGVGTIPLPGYDPFTHYYVVTGQPGEPGFGIGLETWNSGSASWDFDLPFRQYNRETYAYLYTERPLYEPGQVVHFKAVLRQEEYGQYSLPEMREISASIYGEYSPVTGERPLIAHIALPLSSYGTAAGSFTLPAGAPPGVYSLSLDEIDSAPTNFYVEHYRKPEFEILAGFPQKEAQFGENIEAQIKARYYFGAPAGNIKIHWALYAQQENLSLPDNFTAGKYDYNDWGPEPFEVSLLGIFVKEGEASTAPDGTLTIHLDGSELSALLPSDQRQNLTLEITAQDESQIPISERVNITLNPEEFYIGVRSETWIGQAGSPAGFVLQTVDTAGNPVGGNELYIELQKVSWENLVPQDGKIYSQNVKAIYSPVSSVNLITDDQGRARVEFIPPEAGSYLLSAKGQDALTLIPFWVSGPAGAPWPDLPDQRLALRSDASRYRAGETAHVFVPNPFTEKTTGLVTIERGTVLQSWLIEIQGAGYELEIPIKEAFAPDVYLSVTLLKPGSGGVADYRTGYLRLPVEPQEKLLHVEVVSQPQHLQPGAEVSYTIRISDSEEQPVQGEFSIALVDKALLALVEPQVPRIETAFYGAVPLGVSTSLSLASSAQRTLTTARDGLGGGGMESLPPTIRAKFEDTAFWKGDVETDSAGLANLTIKLPDNLTTWVTTVRGLTKDTLVGETSREITTAKDLLIRPVTPRFVVAGDHIQMSALVHNYTATAQETGVSLQAIGFALDENSPEVQKVKIPAGEHRQVSWWGTVQEVEKVELIFSAQAGNLQDAARPEKGALPVLKYVAQHTFASSGVLSNEHERLEVIGLPASFMPSGGELKVELAPSLAATIISGLEALKNYPSDMIEANLSRLLPNVEAYRALKESGLESPTLKASLEKAIQEGLNRIQQSQNEDGGWGWMQGTESDGYLTAYVLLGLNQARETGILVNETVMTNAHRYLVASLETPAMLAHDWQLDRLVFKNYVLAKTGYSEIAAGPLYEVRERLSPWAKALLALLIYNTDPAGDQVKDLVTDLKASTIRSATGAHWEEAEPRRINLTTPNFNTAAVVLALSKIDPASDLLGDALRYLVAHRQISGCWYSSYDTAWVLMALTEALKATGDLQAAYAFSASLNDRVIAEGQAGGATALTPVTASIPLADLQTNALNALHLSRSAGDGRLYYRAYLQLDQPVETIQPLQKGLAISRSYYAPAKENCPSSGCASLQEYSLQGPGDEILVKLTLTLSESMYYLVVEDFIPAGSEIIHRGLKTGRQGTTGATLYDPRDPFAGGYGWWYFNNPQLYDDHIRWMAEFIPAGTYELVYHIVPTQPGEYRVLPAQAYEYYFPEVEGKSAGQIFTIR